MIKNYIGWLCDTRDEKFSFELKNFNRQSQKWFQDLTPNVDRHWWSNNLPRQQRKRHRHQCPETEKRAKTRIGVIRVQKIGKKIDFKERRDGFLHTILIFFLGFIFDLKQYDLFQNKIVDHMKIKRVSSITENNPDWSYHSNERFESKRFIDDNSNRRL